MRRLVVVSKRKSRIIAASAGVALALTSIHMAATARIASLKREQEQVELTMNQQSSPSALLALQNAQQSITKPATPEKSAAKTVNTSANRPAPLRKRQIVISIADRRLAVIEDGRPIKTYPIAVGAQGSPSPDGDFLIINHAVDPVYRHGDAEIGPGKDNPLGSRWMGLSLKGYGIHGTNVQSSVGKAVSHGCFRMRKKDVEELYSLVQVGDTVMVRRERDALIAQVFAPPAVSEVTAITVAAKEPNQDQLAAAATATVETARQ